MQRTLRSYFKTEDNKHVTKPTKVDIVHKQVRARNDNREAEDITRVDSDVENAQTQKRKQKKVPKPPKKNKQDFNGNQKGTPGVPTKEKPHACQLCSECFGNLDELVMHAKIHHTPRKNKDFTEEDIEYFLRVFTKLKRSHCPICHKAILNTLNWRGHMYKHCLTKSIVCKVCGKSFTRDDHRRSHQSRHTIQVLTSSEEEDSENDSDDSSE